MTESDTPASAARNRPVVQYRGRHLPMVAVVIAAFIATALAYSGMVLFGLEVAGMSPREAYALAGFLEVSLVAVALMARNAALEGRPYGVLLTLTWILSGTSGMFAALHEIAVPDERTPYMVAFRFVPPLVAALMWHLALVGERHLVTGHTLDERRREHRVHQFVTALELWRDARLDSAGSRRDLRKVRVAHHRQRAARDAALKLLTVEDFERRMQVWVERLEAAERHGNRLDRIGASSIKRGVSRGTTTGDELVALAAAAAGPPESLDATVAAAAPFEEAFQAALTGEVPAYTPATERAEVRRAEAGRAEADRREESVVVAADAEAEVAEDGYESEETTEVQRPGEAALAFEPLPETGHTRRVEVFGLLPDRNAAEVAEAASPAAPEEPGREQPASERDRRIVELAGHGLTQREIADQVSASRATVSRVLRRYGPSTSANASLELTPA